MKRDGLYHNLLEIIENKDAQINGLKQLVSSLVENIDSMEASLTSYKSLIKEQIDTINLLNKKIFGTKSEKTHSDSLDGIEDIDIPSSISTSSGDTSIGKKAKDNKLSKPRKPFKRPERRTYDEVEEKTEVLMPDAKELKGAKFVRSEKTCRLYMIPAKIVKVIYDRRIYAKGGKLLIPQLPYIPENFQKRHIEPSLMTGILTNKFCYHMPINRQLAMFKNAGADIARSTSFLDDSSALINHFIKSSLHIVRQQVTNLNPILRITRYEDLNYCCYLASQKYKIFYRATASNFLISSKSVIFAG